jgi:hypothetical protein
MNKVTMAARRLVCRVLGHKHYMVFQDKGLYWCWSAGPFDCRCRRCDFKWEDTPEGQRQLEKSREKDPRAKGQPAPTGNI